MYGRSTIVMAKHSSCPTFISLSIHVSSFICPLFLEDSEFKLQQIELKMR